VAQARYYDPDSDLRPGPGPRPARARRVAAAVTVARVPPVAARCLSVRTLRPGPTLARSESESTLGH
jgi:hypothetical protein